MRRNKEHSEATLFELATRLSSLDSFFDVHTRIDRSIANFVAENNEALYAEISHRLATGEKNIDFGEFEYFLSSAMRYIQSITPNDLQNIATPEKNTSFLQRAKQTIAHAISQVNTARSSVSNIIETSKRHGTGWIPSEYKQAVGYSLVALPTLFVIYESMRVGLIASIATTDLSTFTEAILAIYAGTALTAAYVEHKQLEQGTAIVFNPYTTLLGLGITPSLAGLIARVPKHVAELSALAGSLTINENVAVGLLTPVLAALLASSIWSTTDIGFNTIVPKVLKTSTSNKHNL